MLAFFNSFIDLLFKNLKDNAVKVLRLMCQQIWKTAVATGLFITVLPGKPQNKFGE